MTPDAALPAAILWPVDRFGEAVHAVARHVRLATAAMPAPRNPPTHDPVSLNRWLSATAGQLGVTVEPTTATHRDVDRALAAARPALVRAGESVVAVVGARRGVLACLAPDGRIHSIPRATVRRAVASSHEQPHRERIARLLAGTRLDPRARQRAEAGMLDELLAGTVVLRAWHLRLPPGVRFGAHLRAEGMVPLAAGLLAAHAIQYLLLIVSWWAIGRPVLQGHLGSGWLCGWALILLASIPTRMLASWWQGRLAVAVGALLRRRLLAGALALPPGTLARDGVGRLMGRTIESDGLERLALGGGIQSALALLELAVAIPVLVAGAGGAPHAAILVAWLALAAVLAARLARARREWTDERLSLTDLTVEHIVGHRTRLAQEREDRRHDAEDASLSRYADRSTELDARSTTLLVIVPRGWLLVGLAALIPAFVDTAASSSLGVAIGGVLLAWQSLARLTAGVDQLASAHVAWRRVAPLFHAASTQGRGDRASAGLIGRPTAPALLVASPAREAEPVLEAVDLAFRHDGRGADVLEGCNLVVRRGDRVLLQGPSGSGKSTLASLLTGMQTARRGLLLARGLDASCLGEAGWRARVAAAPQFHENHVLGETFAFNLLMGRSWPPRRQDLDDARAVCDELGLGPLIDRMPGGMFQMVGETGWQLSHGERSRLFIARALLQDSDAVILDESLAALDPASMSTVLTCLRARARTLVVIAHP